MPNIETDPNRRFLTWTYRPEDASALARSQGTQGRQLLMNQFLTNQNRLARQVMSGQLSGALARKMGWEGGTSQGRTVGETQVTAWDDYFVPQEREVTPPPMPIPEPPPFPQIEPPPIPDGGGGGGGGPWVPPPPTPIPQPPQIPGDGGGPSGGGSPMANPQKRLLGELTQQAVAQTGGDTTTVQASPKLIRPRESASDPVKHRLIKMLAR